MEWLKAAEGFLKSNPDTFKNIGRSIGGKKKKPKAPPAPVVVAASAVAAPVVSAQAPAMPAMGMSTSTIMMIAGGAVALIAVLFIAMKR